MRLGLAVVLGAACASCTLLVSTSGLVGGEGTPAPGDGDGGAAGDADASLDGGPRGDGSASDSESGSDAGGLPCGEPNVIVCDDFERTTGLGSWTGEQVSTGGAVGTTTMDARRGQRARNLAHHLLRGTELLQLADAKIVGRTQHGKVPLLVRGPAGQTKSRQVWRLVRIWAATSVFRVRAILPPPASCRS